MAELHEAFRSWSARQPLRGSLPVSTKPLVELPYDPNELDAAKEALCLAVDHLRLIHGWTDAERDVQMPAIRDAWNATHGGKWRTLWMLCAQCAAPMLRGDPCPRGCPSTKNP
jgi:hypothetical protein